MNEIGSLKEQLDAMREVAILKSASYMNIGDWDLAAKVIDGELEVLMRKRAEVKDATS